MRVLEGEITWALVSLQQHLAQPADTASMHELGHAMSGTKANLELLQFVLANLSGDPQARELLGELLGELQVRQELAARHLDATARNLQRWYRQIQITLPPLSGIPVVVTSHAIPGTALGLCCAQNRSEHNDAGGVQPARYREAPGLVLTTLHGAGHQPLFRALHHDLFATPELDAEALAGLSDADLKAMVCELLVPEGCKLRVDEDRFERADRYCRSIKERGAPALALAHAMTRRARANMARATAAAALSVDAEKLQRGVDGQVVDLRLFLISMLKPGEAATWCAQAAAFEELAQNGPVELLVGGPDRDPRRVQSRIRVSQFVFSPDQQELNELSNRRPDRDLAELFGDNPCEQSGGRLGTHLDSAKALAGELRNACVTVPPGAGQPAPGSGTPAATPTPLSAQPASLQAQHLEREIRAVEAASRQLKREWAPHRTWPANPELHNQAAARLALIAHLIGDMPILSCMNNNALTQQLDAEVKFLATITRYHGGQLPRIVRKDTHATAKRIETFPALPASIRIKLPEDCSPSLYVSDLDKPPPGLRHVRLQAGEGQAFYEGLHQDAFKPKRLAGPILSRWPTGRLRQFVGLGLAVGKDHQAPSHIIDEACARIRSDPEAAAQFAVRLTNLHCEHVAIEMAGETVVASLHVDAGRRQTLARASAGKSVDADLFNVCLVTRRGGEMLEKQLRALDRLASLPAAPQGASSQGVHPFSPRVNVRGFPLPTTTEPLPPILSERFQAEMSRLLGDSRSPPLAGQVASAVAELHTQTARLYAQEIKLTQAHAHSVLERGEDHAATRKIRQQIDDLKSAATGSVYSAKMLKSTGSRLKQLWASSLGPGSANPQASIQAAAFLALIGYNLGETPVMSCAPTGNCIDLLETTIETYALAAHSNHGNLTVNAVERLLWRQARDAFATPP